jgi:glycosyltransferase involved in cell wall biosynthesis
MIGISFIVITKDSSGTLDRCLSSIEKNYLEGDELILVLNNSDSKTVKIAESFKGRWTVVNEAQQGPAFARNRGANLATKDLLYFVDSDVEVATNFRKYVQEQFSRPWTVAGQIKIKQEKSPHLISRIKRTLSCAYFGRFYNSNNKSPLVSLSIFFLDTASLIVRRNWFTKLGGFNESYRYHEDTEFSLKTLREGGDIFYEDRTHNIEMYDPNERILQFFLKQYTQAQAFPKLANDFAIDFVFPFSQIDLKDFYPEKFQLKALRSLSVVIQYLGALSSPYPLITVHFTAGRNAKNLKKYYLTGSDPFQRSVWIGAKEKIFDIRGRQLLDVFKE